MHYHIILTERCNSQCKYCYEKSNQEFNNDLDKKFEFDFSAPTDSEVDIEILKKFLSKDPKVVIVFYGGEPLVNQKKLVDIMDVFPNIEFCMQTNGKLLNELPKEYMNKFSRILVSLDGKKERTDYNRGKGNYGLVMKNLKLIRKNGYKGEIVARMTISQEFPDIFEQVVHLIEIPEIDSVHWQIDAGFYKFDFKKEKFSEFVEEYNYGISKLIEYWIEKMRKGGVLMLYPFIGIMQDILKRTKTKLRCGAGHSGFAITTNGTITTCPIMNCIKDFYVGNLESDPNNLKEISVIEPCTSCDYLGLCGGRCLYSNHAKLWPKEGEDLICKTVKFLIDSLKARAEEVRGLISQGKIKLEDFEYEKYFGPEIIP